MDDEAFGVHWNIMDETNVTANTTSLPERSIKPYFSYGLGIQRVYKDRFTAYAQIMLRNGGRNGIAVSFGESIYARQRIRLRKTTKFFISFIMYDFLKKVVKFLSAGL